jgi:putative flippase GtrA
MFSSFLSKEFFLFLWTGGVAAIVNFSSRFFYNRFMGFSWAIVAAYLTGMVTAYVLAKTFVFKNTRNSTSQSIFFFTVVNVLALLQTWGISLLLAYKILPALGVQHSVEAIAHLTGIMVPVFTSYVGHKHLSFR